MGTPRSGSRVPLSHRIDGAGPRLVLLHPVGLDIPSWDAVAERLARHFTVLRIDQRGHGASPDPAGDMRLEDYADDIHTLVTELDFGPAAMVGLSFGGMLAQTMAIRHPGDVSALVASGCPSTLPDAARAMMAARGGDAEAGGMEAVLDATMDRWFTPPFLESGAAEPTRRRLLSDSVTGWATAWRAISHLDTASRLNEVTVPTLCIAGDADKSAPPAALQAIADKVAGARVVVLAGAPHMMQLEQPGPYADAVASFLSEGR